MTLRYQNQWIALCADAAVDAGTVRIVAFLAQDVTARSVQSGALAGHHKAPPHVFATSAAKKEETLKSCLEMRTCNVAKIIQGRRVQETARREMTPSTRTVARKQRQAK